MSNADLRPVQELFDADQDLIKSFRATLSEARFRRYLRDSQDDEMDAIRLYRWNSLLSQALYLPLQTWEVALRNKLNLYLCSKFSARWPHNESARRQLKSSEMRKLTESIARQRVNRASDDVSTDSIVADLSAGFWVALLSKGYEVPFTWRRDLRKVFSGNPIFERDRAYRACSGLLDLRNRVAHHEPIYHFDLPTMRADLDILTMSLCRGSHALARDGQSLAESQTSSNTSFAAIWTDRPVPAAVQPRLATLNAPRVG